MQSRESGIVYLVGAGPGDPELLTLKAARIIAAADVIFYDRLVHPSVLMRARAAARLYYVGKEPHMHSQRRQDQICAAMIEEARKGHTVVRLKGGDPLIFGRGGEELLALHRAGIRCVIVPGISAATGVPAVAGVPLTMRGVSRSFGVFTGHDASCDGTEYIGWNTAAAVSTAVFLMCARTLPQIAQRLIEHGRDPSTPVAIIQNGTLPDQRVVVGTLATIQTVAAELEPPVTAVVGEVVRVYLECHAASVHSPTPCSEEDPAKSYLHF